MSEVQTPLTPEQQARLEAIYGRVVEKLKEVVREFTITQDELHVAGNFLNRLGQSGFCRSLVDVNLAMTSVDATGKAAGGTRPNLEGPFHRPHPLRADGRMIDDEGAYAGQPRLILSGRVLHADGAPAPGTVLDFWQADNAGHYDLEGFNLAGKTPADAEGRYRIETVVPRDYSDHDHDPIGELYRALGRHNRRAAHIHVKAWRGDQTVLTTQLFIPGSPYLDSDYVEGAVSDDLQIDIRPAAGSRPDQLVFEATFDFVLPRSAAA
jgi:catechol 1,2-dioxygenase